MRKYEVAVYEEGNKNDHKTEPGRIVVGTLSIAFIILLWAKNDIASTLVTMPKEQIIPLAFARKTNSSSSFGARLDTSADFLFAVVSLVKLLPHIPFSEWLWVWIVAIALIKAVNIGLEFIRNKRLVSVHSAMNKVTGLLLFLFPLTLGSIELKCSTVIVCSIATVSAIQEGYFIGIGRALVTGQERKKQ